MDDQLIIDKLKAAFGQKIIDIDLSQDMPVITVLSDSIFDVVSFLKDDPSMQFEFLTDLCGIHYPERELALRYLTTKDLTLSASRETLMPTLVGG